MMKLFLGVAAMLLVLHGTDARYMGALLCEHGARRTYGRNGGLSACGRPFGDASVSIRDTHFHFSVDGWDGFGGLEQGEIYVSGTSAQAALCYWDNNRGEWNHPVYCPEGHEAVYLITWDNQGRRLGEKKHEIEPVLEEDEASYLEVEINGEKWIVFNADKPQK